MGGRIIDGDPTASIFIHLQRNHENSSNFIHVGYKTECLMFTIYLMSR
jgi:hypothetical protein